MRRPSPVLLAIAGLLGCGGPTAPTGTTLASIEAPEDHDSPGAAAAGPEPIDWLSDDTARCFRGAPEPQGAVLVGDGTDVRVRAGSIAFEQENEGRIVCEASEGVQGRLVLVLGPGGDGILIGALDGDLVEPFEGPQRIVRLAGATEVTTLRVVRYCPDGTTDCVIAGDRTAVGAYTDADPDAPRSGWDLTTRTLSTSRARRARTQWLSEPLCGLEVGLRGVPSALRCTGSLTEQLDCVAREATRRSMELDELEGDDGAEARARLATLGREAAAFQLVIDDGRNELTVPAFEIASLGCVDGHVVFRQATREFSSVRGYGAIEVRQGRISRAHVMSIRDHEEGMSECGNAWDGVQLIPVLRGGVVIGGLVIGAGGRPLFELDRGDVGDLQTPAFWPSQDGAPPRELNETGLAYGDEQIPLALRETPEGLVAIASADPAPACSLEIDDSDGQTNVRPDASTRRAPVGTLPNGTRIVPVEQRGRWYRIEAPTRGWVFATSLRRRCEAR